MHNSARGKLLSSGIFCAERSYSACQSAYDVTFCIYWLASFFITGLNFQVFQLKKDVEFLDGPAIKLIFYASLVSVFCALLWLYGSNYKLLTRLLQSISATKRFGDEDVWDFTFNSGKPEVEYVHVLFETPRVYLARKMDNIDIEFPYRPGTTERRILHAPRFDR